MIPDRRADLRKGWCPGALRPMMARDGLLVRLRITGGIVEPHVAGSLADLAEAHGNGLFDLSARANLQMRGAGEETLPALLDELRRLGLLDADAESEAVRNVIASPLAGFGGAPDIQPTVETLEARLTAEVSLRGLPSKFGFLIDDGSLPSLADVPADVRFDWIAAKHAFEVGLGGTRYDADSAGLCGADDLVDRAIAIARAAVGLQGGQPRRMRSLLQELDPRARSSRFGVEPGAKQSLDDRRHNGDVVGVQSFGGLRVLGLAAAFGRLDATMLREAASIADGCGGMLRLTPWRVILVPWSAGDPGVADPPLRSECEAGEGIGYAALRAARAGFIVDPLDLRLRVAACVGRAGCARGTTPTHEDASALAYLAASLGDDLTPLHVSGCEKGCAKPSTSAVTLVGRDGRYDLVRDGGPGDTPARRNLDLVEIRAVLAAERLQPA